MFSGRYRNLLFFNGIILTTKMRNNPSETATHYKRLPSHGVHFWILLNKFAFLEGGGSDHLDYLHVKREFEKFKNFLIIREFKLF